MVFAVYLPPWGWESLEEPKGKEIPILPLVIAERVPGGSFQGERRGPNVKKLQKPVWGAQRKLAKAT